MQIVEFHPELLPSLTRLINQQIAAVPPGCAFSEEQVAYAIAQGGSLWDIHYPDDHKPYSTWTTCILEHREVVAAAQWLAPSGETEGYTILWLVAQPGSPFPLRTLLHLIDKQVASCGVMADARFTFGVGWFGLPATWTHVIKAMLDIGYQQTERWILVQGATDRYSSADALPSDALHFYWNMNKPVLEWELSAYQDEVKAGECQVWGIPIHLDECPGFPAWATVEWIEVAGDYRRRGIGKRLLAEQMRFQGRRGVKHFLAWTEYDNLAARKLAQTMGFVDGPELVVLRKP